MIWFYIAVAIIVPAAFLFVFAAMEKYSALTWLQITALAYLFGGPVALVICVATPFVLRAVGL